MPRTLQILNLLGVLALAILCAFQWQTNRRLNLQSLADARTMADQSAQLAEKDNTLRGNAADLEDFRTRLIQSESDLKSAQTKLTRATADLAQLTTQRDTLQSNITTLNAAITARDDALKQTTDQFQSQLTKLAADRNDAIQKFNDLATRYTAQAGQLQQAADTLQKLLTDRNNAITKFNDLAAKYNQLIKDTTPKNN